MPLPAWCAKLKRVASVDSWTALPTRGCLGAAGVRGDNNGFAAAFLREVLTFAAGCLAAGCLAAGWFAFAFGTDGWGSATEELELEELDEELEEPEVDEALSACPSGLGSGAMPARSSTAVKTVRACCCYNGPSFVFTPRS